jgi:hypothetical protein
MENLLNHAYFRQHCHHCGHSYTLTLYGVLQEQRLRTEWRNLQDRQAVWDADTLHVLEAIPRDSLEELSAAWDRIVAAADSAGLELLISPGGEESQPHHH